MKQEAGSRKQEVRSKSGFGGSYFFLILILSSFFLLPAPASVNAQQTPSTDVNSSAFSLVVCDGPGNPNGNPPVPIFDSNGRQTGTRAYVLCDFTALMTEAQHLINIMIVLGILAAIAGLCYMGFLYISGTLPNRERAKEMFPKIFWGFIIMLTAWFVVYQILGWLTGNSAFTKLLGNP